MKGNVLKIIIVLFVFMSVFFECDEKKDFSDYELNINVQGFEDESEVLLGSDKVNHSDWGKDIFLNVQDSAVFSEMSNKQSNIIFMKWGC